MSPYLLPIPGRDAALVLYQVNDLILCYINFGVHPFVVWRLINGQPLSGTYCLDLPTALDKFRERLE